MSDTPADDRPTCPHCKTAIRGVSTSGPSHHCLDPCGCRVTTVTARQITNLNESSMNPRRVERLASYGGEQ